MSIKTRTGIAITVAALVLVVSGLQMVARSEVGQQTTAQRPAAPQVKPHDFDWRANFPRSPVPAGDQALASIDGQRLKGYVTEYAAIPVKYRDAGHQYWGRLVGSEADAWTIDWSIAKLKAAGAQDVKNVPMDLPQPQWRANSWSGLSRGLTAPRSRSGSRSSVVEWMRSIRCAVRVPNRARSTRAVASIRHVT